MSRSTAIALVAVMAASAAPLAAQQPALADAVRAGPAALPRSALAVWRGGRWHEWWRSDSAPMRWSPADSGVTSAVEWRYAAPGVDWAELRLAGSGEAWRLRVVLVRIDPERTRFRLEEISSGDGSRGAWTVDSAPARAVVALNAGMFVGGSPWGWVVSGGAERYSLGRGPLSSLFVVDRDGTARLIDPPALTPALRANAVTAFQSYPTLLANDGAVPPPLRGEGVEIDVAHRDARLALGRLRDGRLLVALTRFDALGDALGAVPFGLTTPETAALMGALGCSEAVALDGGISAQLLVRDSGSAAHVWHGLRSVPLGLVVELR